jgi:hypothetical protein
MSQSCARRRRRSHQGKAQIEYPGPSVDALMDRSSELLRLGAWQVCTSGSRFSKNRPHEEGAAWADRWSGGATTGSKYTRGKSPMQTGCAPGFSAGSAPGVRHLTDVGSRKIRVADGDGAINQAHYDI